MRKNISTEAEKYCIERADVSSDTAAAVISSMQSPQVLLVLAILASQARAIKWLAVSQVSAIASSSRDPTVCDQMKGSLIKKQVKFCKRNPGFMDSVRLGAVRAIDECQYQFRQRRWNCSSLQDNVNNQVDLIKAHLGSKMSDADLAGLRVSGLPALPSSSLYSHQQLMYGHGRDTPDMAASQPAINAMFNSYTFKEAAASKRESRNSRNSRNVRGRGRRRDRERRSRKARRNLDVQMSDMPRPSPPVEKNVTTPEVAKNKSSVKGKPAKGDTKATKGKLKKTTLADLDASGIMDWQSAVGPHPVVSPGTREASFVHAISSAGVAHAVTRSCSSGELENCGCDRSLRGMSPEGFQWSGCSDNVDFGVTFSRTFVDAQDRRKSRKKPRNPVSLMNLHNNEAGRKLLERTMKVECKCHGVSGSCELKTCWRSLASFRMIGAMLKEKFDGAHEVKQKRKNGRRMLMPKYQRYRPHQDTDLVYLATSPDYCEYDVKKGSLGTKGRECDPNSKGIDGCDLLCCNRGYTTRRERRTERCKCKFHWCCYVECEECVRDVQISTCN